MTVQLNDLPPIPPGSAVSSQSQQPQHHRYHHLHHDPAYNITTAEADLDYNSDNSLAAVLHQQQQQQHHPAAVAPHHAHHHHHRYMPSSSSSCDNTKQPTHRLGGSPGAGGSCDENTPSVLDINLDTKKISLATAHHGSRLSSPARFGSDERKYTNNHHHHHHHHSHHIEVYSDGGANVLDNSKLEEEISEDDRGPPLPPRPAPRTRTLQRMDPAPSTSGVRKYVIWCLICGGISSLLGVLFLGIYFLLRSYTSTVGYFETVPTFVPATLLMLTGICIMSLARRRNRYSYLIKLSGACGLASALTCALVTVTTTVLHMSRLQVLRECEYTQKTRTCTCYSVTADKQTDGVDDSSVRFVFDSTSDCGVVHGALYSCLRAVFGLSVAGVLVAVFSCMLVYQLLSHERKKMYWEQLELRCRSLYSGQQGAPSVLPSGPGMLGGVGSVAGGPVGGGGRAGNCRCCEQCHAHRNALPSAYPWEGDNRFWTPGQAGNFYSPNPGGDEPGGSARLNASGRRLPGWSWPRMPWQRSDAAPQRMSPHSPDSQYGFSGNRAGPGAGGPPGAVGTLLGDSVQPRYNVIDQQYGIWGPPPPYSDPNSPARRGRYQYIHPGQCGPPLIDPSTVGMVGTGPMMAGGGMAQNGPGSGITILECHQHAVMGVDVHGIPQQYVPGPQPGGHQSSASGHPTQSAPNHYPRGGNNSPAACINATNVGAASGGGSKRQQTGGGYGKERTQTKDNYENTPSDSDGPGRDRFSNTLPLRKAKKRVEAGAKSIGPNVGQPASRVNVQNVFGGANQTASLLAQTSNPSASLETSENEYHEPSHPSNTSGSGTAVDCLSGGPGSPMVSHRLLGGGGGIRPGAIVHPPKTRRLKQPVGIGGVENSGFQTVEALEAEAALNGGKLLEPTESEVYFADVSSCCNMSVKNDNYYEDAGQKRSKKDKQQQQMQQPDQADEYIAQRFGRREPSVRSRLPFPQTALPLGEKPQVMPRSSLIPKDISRQSMCSVDSGEKTDYTDLSPATPSTNFPSIGSCYPSEVAAPRSSSSGKPSQSAPPPPATDGSQSGIRGDHETPGSCNFIASYPYSSNEQSQEAHRRSTKNLHDIFLAPDSQYEVIKELHRFKTTPLSLTPFDASSSPSSSSCQDLPVPFPSVPAPFGAGSSAGPASVAGSSSCVTVPSQSKPKSPKNLNITPIKRQSLGTNISSIIQNLSGNDVGLLYPEGRHTSSYNQSDESVATGSASSSGRRESTVHDVSASSNEDNEDTSNDERCGGGGGGSGGDRRL
ncbi:uncharacterized protein LOC128266960 [Anopheles cruzii]|uniref:uncharacterized protein LOC128266960 n=1 Tax=Anopheles cruzii TaxID=68878 RepID=UPI0022EC528E|nr:uncharacterized protein LOC128266960 [Anopheles cruzii]